MLREYLEGEHGGGFVGMRVVVKWNKQSHQEYFSFKQYGEDAARQLAGQLHEQWLTKKARHHRVHKIPKPKFKKFPKGMTASAHHKRGFSYITLVVYNHDQSKKRSYALHYDDYKRIYMEALLWLEENRNDFANPSVKFPYHWPYFARLATR